MERCRETVCNRHLSIHADGLTRSMTMAPPSTSTRMKLSLVLSTLAVGCSALGVSTPRCHGCRMSGALEAHAAEVANLHREMAANSKGGDPKGSAAHAARQVAAFSQAADFFASVEATPDEVMPNMAAIARAAMAACNNLEGRPRLLDVGTGTGALLPFYEECGIHESDVTGVDLCASMLAHARARFPSATFIEGDFLDVEADDDRVMWSTAEPYDVVVFNAVFGNLYDQSKALAHAAALLRPGGSVVISHPLGAAFVHDLHVSDPTVVPHELPDRLGLTSLLYGAPPLRLTSFTNQVSAGGLYLASLTKSEVGPLPAALGGKLPSLRGPVAEGFGRGSRKLGIPTANLPCSLFQKQLAELPCGVYVGWAAVRGDVHKCVANIGFSPTFAGAENPEKIVEAHIMSEFDSDFYGEQMGLLLLAFIREERKFGGLDELLATIRSDIATASDELDTTPLAEAAFAPCLSTVGGAGMRLIDPDKLLEGVDPGLLSPGNSVSASREEVETAPPAGYEWGGTY